MKSGSLVIVILFNFLYVRAQESDSVKTEKEIKREKIIVPWFVERFKISAGGFYVVNKTSIQVGINGDDATVIDGEKDMGLNKEVGTFLANMQWRISRRSRISLNYYNVNRSSNHTLKKDIVFDDNIYPVNSSVYTFFNTAIYQFSYGYAILSKPTYEAGVFIGTHIVGANTGISLHGTSSGASVSNNFGFTAPLPDIGIWGGFATSNRFAINGDISYFTLTTNQNTGRLLAFNLTFIYRLVKRLDLSLGYSGLDFKVITTKKDVTGNFKWGYNGPLLAVNFSFGKNHWSHPAGKD
ncbi:MAG TPA: hypothetical protein VFI33_10955 [Puia sp.]|nr:hypothetical protein [Puia sp.]